jgi:hypothetical protein
VDSEVPRANVKGMSTSCSATHCGASTVMWTTAEVVSPACRRSVWWPATTRPVCCDASPRTRAGSTIVGSRISYAAADSGTRTAHHTTLATSCSFRRWPGGGCSGT